MRDRAALLALAKEAGGNEGLQTVANAVREKMVARVEYTTTQEQAWLVLAAHAMAGDSELAYSVDGDAQRSTKEPVVINPDAAAIEKGVHIRNQGDRPIWLQVTARGVPKEFVAIATEKVSAINEAYSQIAKERRI